MDEDVYVCGDIEALPDGERGLGLGVGAGGANSGVDASDAYGADDAHDANDAMVAVAAQCDAAFGFFLPSHWFFPALSTFSSLPTDYGMEDRSPPRD